MGDPGKQNAGLCPDIPQTPLCQATFANCLSKVVFTLKAGAAARSPQKLEGGEVGAAARQ